LSLTLPVASMGKEVMDCGEEFDMMEHGADVKHDVPRRGTGVRLACTMLLKNQMCHRR
jgi:hypothetical protein